MSSVTLHSTGPIDLSPSNPYLSQPSQSATQTKAQKVFHAVKDSIIEIAFSAGLGLIGYGVGCLAQRWAWVVFAPGYLAPLPFILTCVAPVIVLIACRIIWALGKQLVGSHLTHEEIATAKQGNALQKLRAHSWTVINCLNQHLQNIDEIFSRIFHIATFAELKKQNIRPCEKHRMEIIREAFIDQVKDSFVVFQFGKAAYIGTRAVTATGLKAFPVPLALSFDAFMFVTGFISKILEEHHQVKVDRRQKEKEERLQDRAIVMPAIE